MERIDCLIFGYRRFSVSADDVPKASSLLLRAGVSVYISSDGRFSVRRRDTERVIGVLDGNIEYKVSELLGLPGAVKEFRFKKGALVGGVVAFLMLILLSMPVWDVRVDGNEGLPDAEIVYELSRQNFYVGRLWFLVDRSEVENAVLAECTDLSWISINRRGTVAYVTVAGKDGADNKVEPLVGYSNLVAICDCVVEEITVYSGVAVVKPGDSVKKGDLLICGVVPESAGGGFCHADGAVIGRISDRVCTEVTREYEEIVSTKRMCTDISLKIFNFSINIFKRYGNYAPECDIIKEIRAFSLPGGVKLPLELSSSYVTVAQTEPRSYSDAELVRICSARLQSSTLSRIVGAELVKIRTFGDYTESGYKMYSDIVFLAQVGEKLPFDTEE